MLCKAFVKRITGFGFCVALLASISEPLLACAAIPDSAPDIRGRPWINSAPLSLARLKGRVILVDFWTYACGNCRRALPYVASWHERYAASGLVVIGVHTPEFDDERIDANVRAAVKRLGIRYPVVEDNDYRIWNGWCNRFWPALYLIDHTGRIVYHHFGEGDYTRTEAEIRALLAAANR